MHTLRYMDLLIVTSVKVCNFVNVLLSVIAYIFNGFETGRTETKSCNKRLKQVYKIKKIKKTAV
jgi:hypothetical protein